MKTAGPLTSPSAIAPRHQSRLGGFGLTVYNLFYWPYLMASCAVLFVPALALFLLTAW